MEGKGRKGGNWSEYMEGIKSDELAADISVLLPVWSLI